jgi:hypothetical protein
MSEFKAITMAMLGKFHCVECDRIKSADRHLARHPYGPGPICKRCAVDVHDMEEQEDGSYA